jgi:hypothetical protein
MTVRSLAGGLGTRRAEEEPSARTGGVSPNGGDGTAFRALEAESFIKSLSRNRRYNTVAA